MEKTPEKNHDPVLWNQFCRLGEMIGDGLHLEPDGKWISKEYKRLSRILIPEIRQEESAFRKAKNTLIDEKMSALLQGRKCECSGAIKQSRSGSMVAYCEQCKQRYKAKSVKKTK